MALTNRRAAMVALGLGIAFDIAFNDHRPGLSAPIFFVLLSSALLPAVGDSKARALLLAAPVFSGFVALRASPSLIVLDLLAVPVLLVAAAASDAAGIAEASAARFLLMGHRVLRALPGVPAFIAEPVTAALRRAGQRRPALRTAAVAAPVLLVFAALLASADRVFANLITPSLPDWNFASLPGHFAVVVAGAFFAGLLWRAAVTPGARTIEELPHVRDAVQISAAQWTAVLVGVAVLFFFFVIVQFAFLFGGNHRVLVTPGLTYAEYARSGFFQLIAVALLAVALITTVWDLGEHRPARFRTLAVGLVVLCFVILASALTRLRLYEQAFGFTTRRFYAYAIIAWIGAVLLALTVCVWKRRRERFVTAALAAAMGVLFIVNVSGVDGFVASRNVARWRATGKIDASYMGALSADATPAAVALLPHLSANDASALRAGLCSHGEVLSPEPGWQSLNLTRSRARRALEAAGIDPAACARSGG